MWCGLGVGVGRVSARLPVGEVWHVDSVNGDDSNPGTLARPFQTLSALPAPVAGQTIALARGSRFRERLHLTANNVSVVAYGPGQGAPQISAADPVTSWSKTAGLAFVFEAAFTVEGGSDAATTFPRAFEDDMPLARQASPSAVDAVPGSYHVTGSYPTYTLYVRTGDDGDPSANGSVYEVSTRLHGIDCPVGVSGCTVNGIACEKPAHIDGAIVLRGRRQTIRNAAARHGSKHNWFIGSGLVDTVEAAHAEYAGSLALGAIFLAEPAGETATVRNAGFVGATQISSGLICHAGAGAATRYASLTLENLSGQGVGTFLNYRDVETATITSCDAVDCGAYVAVSDVATTISGGTLEDTLNNTSTICWITAANAHLTITGQFTVRVKGSNIALVWVNGAANASVHIDGLVTDPVHTVNWTRLVTASDAHLEVENTWFNACHQMYDLTAMRSLLSDNNTVATPAIICRIDGVTHASLAAYQAAHAPLDAMTGVGPLP